MSEIVTMRKIVLLMNYLKMESYVIPHYNLPTPKEVEGNSFRHEKVFKLYKDGTMSYKGYGYGKVVKEIYIENIKPDERYLTRAYLHLVNDARKRVKHRSKYGGMPNLEYLILKFNFIDFIDGEDAIIDNYVYP